ncbi:basic amino acid ABC transporter substrate-binding protein [Paenibacillus sp. sptzw28]|uniref:basic amino acid ABC transporter substrate-binding protein n=1 Tax=Paenibacillus sp. sptzw28 TaxID=715179 RepID=UPI001C6F07DA|nr:basic amino acid ABC transporter substrate-binding protein [Paenibacillus sp. sptzw28]QYR21420.1 basic amino acid ABC transporter substrate-binding protein [Paenibacillus sp. sptzw28]
MRKRIMLTIITFTAIAIAAGCGARTDNGGSNTQGAGSAGNGNSGITYMIGSDASYEPMEFMDKDKITGFDIDFLAAVMNEAGLKYEVNNVAWDTMLESVKQGKEYQAGISAISITDDRKQTFDFSIPYFESTNVIMVKKGSGIKSALDLKGKKVAVQGATTADTLMTEIMGKGNTDLKRFDSNAVALLEMDKGGVDAVVADIAIVNDYIKNNPGKKYEDILDPEHFHPEYYGIAYPKGSELKAKLDPVIRKVIENGKYAEVYKKWFGKEPNTENLLNAK